MNYEEIILEQGKEKLNYTEISYYYNNIIFKIYEEINKKHPTKYNPETDKFEYSQEYLDAYNIFHESEWRLKDIIKLKNHPKDEDYPCFAIEQLSYVRLKIKHYLENTKIKFSTEIYEYTKYDEILKQRIMLKKEHPDYNTAIKKWEKILYKNTEKEKIEFYINNIKEWTNILKKEIMDNKIKYYNTEELKENIKLLEKIEKDLKI